MNYQILNSNTIAAIENHPSDLYSYTLYTGPQVVDISERDSCWYIKDNHVHHVHGPVTVDSTHFAVVIYGYKGFDRSAEINDWTTLPYINGCSTTQLLTPIRKGDPTFQLLRLPPHTSEQQHHIHSTARIVYVQSGRGYSVIGASGKHETIDLTPGTIILLDKMVPHHFVTEDEPLVVLPLHIYSSIGQSEWDHPMFNGTHKI
jgi:mannose-6-phosphate isomerase-like protein (cupin superfamily)